MWRAAGGTSLAGTLAVREPLTSTTASSVTEVTGKNIESVIRLEEAARQARSRSDRFSDAVAHFCGSMAFLWTHVAWFSLWILSNTVPGGPRFDPVPFPYLTLAVSLEAIFLSTFILTLLRYQVAQRTNNQRVEKSSRLIHGD